MRLLAMAALALAGTAAQGTPAPLAVPPLNYHQRTLANGLEVISLVDHSSPNVSVQMWYHVGSKNDPDGRSGFAHLFEHLMFKSTKHMHAEQMDQLTEAVGGMNNASTGGDITNYFEVVPSNHLQRLLWAEAERLSNLTVDEANFKSERAVVEEEYRQRTLASPYGLLFNALDADSYLVHPYKRPTIGNIAELEAASLADVIAFHQTYYRPDNATLIVVGDFEPQELRKWVDEYFAPIKHPATKIPRVTVTEPAWTKDRHYVEHGANVPLPAVADTWLIPPAADADAVPLNVAAAILGNGESSRLYQSLVYRDQLAADVSFDTDLRQDQGLMVAFAIVASGKQPGDVRNALLAEVAKLAAKPVGAAELDKVKTELLTGELKQRQTAIGKAFALGDAALNQGDVARANTDLAALQAVTPADIQRVVKKYLVDAHRVSIDYSQAPADPSAHAATTGGRP